MTNAKGFLVSEFGGPVGEALTAADCKILNRVAKALIKLGAASEERLQRVCRLEQRRTVQWALLWLGAKTNTCELFWLPE